MSQGIKDGGDREHKPFDCASSLAPDLAQNIPSNQLNATPVGGESSGHSRQSAADYFSLPLLEAGENERDSLTCYPGCPGGSWADGPPLLITASRNAQDTTSGYGSIDRLPFISNTAGQLPNLPSTTKAPFHKWVQTLHRRRHIKRQRAASLGQLSGGIQPFPQSRSGSLDQRPSDDYRGQASSVSSFAFVSAAREASLSFASMSIRGPSWRQTQRSSKGLSRTDRSSRASYSVRQSEDSQLYNMKQQQQVDPAVLQRSQRRRQILEELIETEEGYIGDIRFLMSAYLTILASSRTVEIELRSFMSRNLTEIVQLHEELLGDLRKFVPDADYGQIPRPATADALIPGHHHRWKSLDAVPEYRTGDLCRQQGLDTVAEPSTAADVAKAFTKKMNRFFIYEEYGARYDAMAKNLGIACSLMSNWERNQRGLETLAHCLGSTKDNTASRKALAISDLLAKPIQRLCRYPLLFTELLKCTPVCDSPEAHLEIDNTLSRLREVTGAMNQATNDIRAPVEKTWLLQDRLLFPNQKPDAISKSRIRALGHIQLCGVLHICWQTKTSVQGKYMICLLYRKWFCLAVAEKADRQYTIQACFPLSCCSLEETDNRRGLQCHTAPFSWKLVFECNSQLYEIIMSACSPKEEWEWRDRLSYQIEDDTSTQADVTDGAFLALDIKSFGTVFGKPGTVARRLSIRRATTVGSKSQPCQVIVQNTSLEKDATTVSPKKACINRSRSLQSNSRIPVLAPSRGERARLEALVSDVWTRDILPFPGMSARARRERHVRSSASSLMQRISASSLASTFGKRSIGRAGLHKVVLGVGSESSPPLYAMPPASGTADAILDEEQTATASHDEDDVNASGIRRVCSQVDPPSELSQQENSPERSRERSHRRSSEVQTEQQRERKECDADFPAGQRVRRSTTSQRVDCDTNQLTGTLRRTLARIFEESKRYEYGPEETRGVLDDKRSSDVKGGSTLSLANQPSRGRHTFPARRQPAVRPSILAESMRCASVASAGTDGSRPSSLLSSHASALEVLAPLTRQKGRAPSANPRAKRPVLLRGSIRESFRSLVH